MTVTSNTNQPANGICWLLSHCGPKASSNTDFYRLPCNCRRRRVAWRHSPAWRRTSWGFLCSCCNRWRSSAETPAGRGSCRRHTMRQQASCYFFSFFMGRGALHVPAPAAGVREQLESGPCLSKEETAERSAVWLLPSPTVQTTKEQGLVSRTLWKIRCQCWRFFF